MAKSTSLAGRERRGWKFVRARPRLYLAIAAGVAAALLIPASLSPMRRAVTGWDFGIAVYLGLLLQMAVQATPQSMSRRAQLEDATRWLFLTLMAGAAWFSMFALLSLLHDAHGASGHLSLELTLLAGATILLSWLLAHTTFALHYAHDYYADLAAKRPKGLLFPGDEREPDYWDFLYFSFVVGMTCQVSDVQVATRFWRRLVLAHGIVAFLFNTVVLALSINLLAGQL
ncbi:MAG TPA: DUF1345 domain-containing protein [Stellaceae bacterium]|nr:DUF1345 domain-containing protein [Stellaceae bacterium]